MTRVRTLILVLGFVLAPFLLAKPAAAITLIPPSLEYGVKPGEKLQAKVKLFNETAQPITAYASTDNFTAADDSGTAKFLNTPTEDLASWISIAKDPIIIQPGERAEVPFDVNVPTNADPGGHYGVIFFGDQPNAPAGGSAVAVTSKIAMLLILRVEGAINESALVSEFKAGPTKSFTRLPVEFDLRIANNGNVHVRPHGNVTVRNSIGGTSVVLSLNDSRGAVLPKSDRLFKTLWQKDADSVAKDNFFKEISNQWHNFAFGPYTAEAVMIYGLADDKTLQATLKFWIFPWQLLLTLLVGAILIIFLLVFFIRWYNRWIVAKAQGKGGGQIKKP